MDNKFYDKLDEIRQLYEEAFKEGVAQEHKDADPRYLGIPNINFSLDYDDKLDFDKTNEKKYAQQRKERGFDDSELWSFDYTIARFILPRLERFREATITYPARFNSMEEWYAILDKMIEGFRIKVEDNDYDWSLEKEKENEAKIQEAIDLLAKHFFDLWW